VVVRRRYDSTLTWTRIRPSPEAALVMNLSAPRFVHLQHDAASVYMNGLCTHADKPWVCVFAFWEIQGGVAGPPILASVNWANAQRRPSCRPASGSVPCLHFSIRLYRKIIQTATSNKQAHAHISSSNQALLWCRVSEYRSALSVGLCSKKSRATEGRGIICSSSSHPDLLNHLRRG